jgi:hypothetical protein
MILEAHPEIEFLKADGFDDAVIGLELLTEKLIYSKKKCLAILMERDGMDAEEALEYFDYNVESAYVGKKTPVFVDDMFYS